MSGLIQRMHGLFLAQGHAQLDRLEDPAVMSQQLLREADEDLHRLRQQMVAAASRGREIGRSLEQLDRQIAHHDHKARQALSSGDEASARHHLALKLRLAREHEDLCSLRDRHNTWLAGLREERTTLLRERESLASQARIIGLRRRLGSDTPAAGEDAYSRLMQRRERMARYSEAQSGGLDDLLSAQSLRHEELGELPADDALDVDAALAALRDDLNREDAA